MKPHQVLTQNPCERDPLLAAESGENEPALMLFGFQARRFRSIVRRTLSSRLRILLDPDDILQEIAVVLLTKPLPIWITTASDLARYISRVARNMAITLNRKYLGGRHHSLDHEVPLDSVPEEETPSSQEPSSSDRLQQKEAVAELQEWLPLRMREVVAWVCAGYSVAEVAASHDIDEETVIMFVCTANNFGPHPEIRISQADALRLFKPRSHLRRQKSIA